MMLYGNAITHRFHFVRSITSRSGPDRRMPKWVSFKPQYSKDTGAQSLSDTLPPLAAAYRCYTMTDLIVSCVKVLNGNDLRDYFARLRCCRQWCDPHQLKKWRQ
jgi:hypothetical protein